MKRLSDWHTDTGGTKPDFKAWNLERVRCKWHSRQGCIEKRADKFKVGKQREVFVTHIAREGAVISLAISRRKRRGESREVIEEVIATAFVISAELRNVLNRMWADDTGSAWICVRINGQVASVKRRSCRVRSRVRRRRVLTEK